MRIQRAPSAGADANGTKELPSKCTDIGLRRERVVRLIGVVARA
jgi:hypothetical protein